MDRRWFGLALLLVALFISAIIIGNVKTFYRMTGFALDDDGNPLMDRIVWVPPWNSTEGWVGFSATLPHKEKVGYEAYGIILPNDTDPEPKMVMRIVNETGLSLLRFDQFEPVTWNITDVYASAFLERNRLADEFRFLYVDDSSKYVLLFRGLKNETLSRPILISLKEAWYEEKPILEPSLQTNTVIVIIAVLGIVLIAIKPRPSRRRRLRKRASHSVSENIIWLMWKTITTDLVPRFRLFTFLLSFQKAKIAFECSINIPTERGLPN